MRVNRDGRTVTELRARGELWRDVVGYEGLYEVSSRGNVRSLDRVEADGRGGTRPRRGLMMRPKRHRYGHQEVALSRSGVRASKLVHRLVLESFTGECPPGMEACHGNGTADDNLLGNLRWDTASANQRDSVRDGTHNMARRTECKNGHPFTPENTRVDVTASGGVHRVCRACKRERERARYATRKQKGQ